MRAASIASLFSVCNPASSTSMKNGEDSHTSMRTTEASAQVLLSHDTEGRPIALSA